MTRKAVAFAAAAALAGGAVAAALPAHAATPVAWSATATRATHLEDATPLGAVPATTRLSITVGLKLRNEAALKRFIADEANPASPTFGQVLTPASFTATYGPTRAQATAVADYLARNGFTHVTVSSNRLLVTADGTAAQAEGSFHTTLARFDWRGTDVFVNTRPAMVPRSLAGTVVGVLGLNDAFRFTATPVRASAAHRALSTGVPQYLTEYSPQGFWKAYQADGQPFGSKTTIATFAEGNLAHPLANLRVEERVNHLPQVPVTVEHVGIPSTDTSGNVEWDLDSQFATGMAGNVAHFYFYDTTSLTDSDLARAFNAFAAQDLAKGGSASLGECEVYPYLDGSMLIDDEVFAEAAAQGQTVFASAGDTGASCAVESTNGVPDSGPPMVNYPATSPYVVGVGGTTLLTNSNGTYDAELSWYAGSGGISDFESQPYWQTQVIPAVYDADYTGGRGVPDIAMDADPESGANVYTSGSFEGVGGTSLSSPLALGVWARLETAYGNRIGFAGPVLYNVYLHGSCETALEAVQAVCSTPAFHAPVAGDNGLYPETPGYNFDTGLGTFDVAQMMHAIGRFVPRAMRVVR